MGNKSKSCKPIGHEAILASAGSGKTFQLAHRYIRLLVSGSPPERICALTFSRKAAGEILESIVEHLCKAASSDAGAVEMSDRIGRAVKREEYLETLRAFLGNLDIAQISTLDSFIVGVIKAFPMELGISADVDFMDEGGSVASAVRREVLGRIFYGETIGKKAQREFLEAFKLATFGRNEKNVESVLDRLITDYQSLYQIMPRGEMWGDPGVVWPGGSAWLSPVTDVQKAGRDLQTRVGKTGWPANVQKKWTDFADAASSYDSASEWGKSLGYVFERIPEVMKNLADGSASIKVFRTNCEFGGAECDVLLKLIAHVMNVEMNRAVKRTAGIFDVMEQYEKAYDPVRRGGHMTFGDAQYLLTSGNTISGGAVISRNKGTEGRLYIDYRLDSRLDHWLIDEFQDTSDLQWEVFRNLADETLQDASGKRSFFCVGDMKQAIYAWRGGNPSLFARLIRDYPQLGTRPLNRSFRSCADVIETVNKVFGRLPEEIPGQVREQWKTVWQNHEAAEGKVPAAGYAVLLEPVREGDKKQEREDIFRVVAGIIREMDPHRRGLSVAVLVRSNDLGQEIADYLRGACEGIPVALEGRAGICDNPVVEALMSLIRLAAHPGDTLAWQHIQMTPLAQVMEKRGLTLETLPVALLGDLQSNGFRATLLDWGSMLNNESPLDEFGRARLSDLAAAAAEFDATGSRDCNEFVAMIEEYSVRDEATGGGVRVMTIHQSKGLGFDAVILPDLMKSNLGDPGAGSFLICRNPSDDRPLWGLCLPNSDAVACDGVLRQATELAKARSGFEDMCVLYVAMTRAKQGLYLVTSFPGASSGMFSAAAFLKKQLCASESPEPRELLELPGTDASLLHETGTRDWYATARARKPAKKAVPVQRLPSGYAARKPVRPVLKRVEPSSGGSDVALAAEMFKPAARAVMDFGSAIHELFEKIEWIETADIKAILQEWRGMNAYPDDIVRDVSNQFIKAVESPGIRDALSNPPGRVELWRERPFEAVLGDRWVSGKFDRVVICRDDSGKVISAEILDFKSKGIGAAGAGAEIDRYRPQMSLYREALAFMLGIERSSISCGLVFTKAGRVVGLE